jgi:methylthioribose-1-phosphate isomerase
VERALAAADPAEEAGRVAREDVERNRRLGAAGAGLLAGLAGEAGQDGRAGGGDLRVLTHCNAGGLACAGYGTAVGMIRAAHEDGLPLHVWVGETRPVLQGARLTAWELERLGISCTVVVDSMAGGLMAAGEVDCVVVGADRVAANGDTANKVGTYPLAVLARHHRIPFYVAAPTPTVDLACGSGAAIPIERRGPDEVACVGDRRVVPAGVTVDNRAFDVTPAALVTAVVTEAGVARPPYRRALARLVAEARPTTQGDRRSLRRHG